MIDSRTGTPWHQVFIACSILALVIDKAAAEEPYRSPIALAATPDGSRVITANQTAGSVSLVDPRRGRVLDECKTGDRPAGVAITPDGKIAVVTHWYGYDLVILDVESERLVQRARVEVGPEPRGVVLTPDGRFAYTALGVANEVVRVDLSAQKVTGRVQTGREPRHLALSPDSARLLVGVSRAQNLTLIRLSDFEIERVIPIDGDNLRQVAISNDGSTGFVANMRNRGFATTRSNIDQGWVLGQRLTRVALNDKSPYEALTLDPQGKAASDAHGVAVNRDGSILAVSSGGTGEVFLFNSSQGRRLPWRSNGSRDLMAADLISDQERFRRIEVGGRPTELAFADDGETLLIANYLADSVQVVNAKSGSLIRSVQLGGPKTLSSARKGEILFHDARRSFNQWYSCNTCHSDGHTNGLNFDTMNDGWHDFSTAHDKSKKKIPTLRRVAKTGPWTWHGWQSSLDSAMSESFTKSMQGPRATEEEVSDIVAYLETLEYPRNPYRDVDGSLSEAAKRGEQVFRSAKAACNTCHGGQEFTDGKIHDVGLGERGDVYRGYNPPSLRGVYDKDPYLHDGRSRSLRDALTGPHRPDEVTGLGTLSESELNDLIEYLKSL